ncbi:MAG: hypothetical protein L3J09_12040 [Flavobacteriaceae bacterium]|nr:hypothetical protein [Flavobacteriaceae bacterium]
MKTKWYFGTFIFLLTLFVVNQQQISIPNQQIVIQFVNNEVASVEVQQTIATIKKQLKLIGVEHIQIRESENGSLKISYFSDVNIASIKKIISEENEFQLGVSSISQNETSNEAPLKEKSNTYKLDVYEIQKGDDSEKDLNRLAFELKPEIDRFFKPNVYLLKIEIDVWKTNKIEKVAFTIQKNIATEINKVSHIIPEVRAGPISFCVS